MKEDYEYVLCDIEWKDGEVSTGKIFKTNLEVINKEDDHIFYYAESLDKILEMARNPNENDDFKINKVYLGVFSIDGGKVFFDKYRVPIIADGIRYELCTKPYDAEVMVEIDGEEVEVPMTFYDGYAINKGESVLITYSTIQDLMRDAAADFNAMDMFHDREINYYQVQYFNHKETILDKEKINEFLNTLQS